MAINFADYPGIESVEESHDPDTDRYTCSLNDGWHVGEAGSAEEARQAALSGFLEMQNQPDPLDPEAGGY